MDIEWAKDGTDGLLYVVQARPETVQSRSGQVIERYILKGKGEILATGRSIGIASAPAGRGWWTPSATWPTCSRATCWSRT
jgi:phosphoenolpyruvate synthase/pyruvate phosphate dikinase